MRTTGRDGGPPPPGAQAAHHERATFDMTNTIAHAIRASRRAAFLAALAVAAPFVLAACGKEPAAPAAPAEIAVRTAPAAERTVVRTRMYPGNTASVRPVQIAARVQGFLARQHAADGATVKAGDILYTIEEAPYRAALAQADAGVAQADAARGAADAGVAQAEAVLAQAEAAVPGARASYEVAKSDYARNEPLAASGAVSAQTLDQLRARRDEAESKLRAAEAQVVAAQGSVKVAAAQVAVAKAQSEAAAAARENALLNLSYCTVTAPMDGLLGKSRAFEGQMVGPGYTTTLNELVQLDPMWAQFSPSATDWPVVADLLAKGPVRATVVYGGVDARRAEGELSFVSNAADQSTGTMPMRATFANPEGLFRPGTYCEVTLSFGEVPGVLMIPMAALVARETDFFVWRVKADGTVENVRVEVGAREGVEVGVTAGLSAGDRVVTAGMQKLREGMRVREAGDGEAKDGTTRDGASAK
ncbi:MAG: hypothetical protein RI967_1080 [Planctomycetota bacterium]